MTGTERNITRRRLDHALNFYFSIITLTTDMASTTVSPYCVVVLAKLLSECHQRRGGTGPTYVDIDVDVAVSDADAATNSDVRTHIAKLIERAEVWRVQIAKIMQLIEH